LDNKHLGIIELEKSLTVTLYAKAGKSEGGSATNKITPDDFEYIMPLGRGAFGEVILVR
jgi:hypothetical protein